MYSKAQSLCLILLFVYGFTSCRSDQENNLKSIASSEHVQDSLDLSKPNRPIDNDSLKSLEDSLSHQLDSLSANAADKFKDTLSNDSPKKKIPRAKPVITFKNMRLDAGKITQGEIINTKFEFRNTGKAPLEILSAKGSCGCTQPSFPFLAIPPGESGFIGVEYNSVGKSGAQNVDITIKTNASKNDLILNLNVFVEEDNSRGQMELDSTKS